MTVIAMTREMGTLGKDVAAGLSDTLGLNVIHHELVEQHLAERLKTTESTVHRFMEGEASMWERWNIDSKRLSRYTAEEILQLAQGGDVLIRGWGAAQLLSDVQHVICVRIYAPMANRVREMKQRLGTNDTSLVEREIERSDAAHARAVQRQFGGDWRDPNGYDIALNSGRVPIDACVRQIRLLADHPAYEATDASRAKLRDKLIEARVGTSLDEIIDDLTYSGSLRIEVSGGKVEISGVTTDAGKLQRAIAAVKSVDGVASVDNRVHVADLQPGI